MLSRKSSFYVSSADALIDIPLLEMKNDDEHKPLQLCSAYNSVKCIIDDKGMTQSFPIVMSHLPKVANSNLVGNCNTHLVQVSHLMLLFNLNFFDKHSLFYLYSIQRPLMKMEILYHLQMQINLN